MKTDKLSGQTIPPYRESGGRHAHSILLKTAAAVLLLLLLFCGAAAAADQSPFPNTGVLESTTYTLTGNIALANLSVLNGVTCTIDLAGYELKGNGSSSVIIIESGGNLTLKDSSAGKTGKVTGGRASYGGGVYVSGGTFTMNGGSITGNTATNFGGGVYVNGGTFNMNGGNITGNTATNFGGGVYVNGGTFNMGGGCITGNNAKNGGGVYVMSGTFNMTGGTISDNEVAGSDYARVATEGGGVFVMKGTFNMDGGEIIRNKTQKIGGCGGLYVYYHGTFTVCGNSVIRDNHARGNLSTNGVNNVYYYPDDRLLTLTGPFTGDIRISFILYEAIAVGQPFGRVAEGVDDTTAMESAAHFHNDDGKLHGTVKNGELVWAASVNEEEMASVSFVNKTATLTQTDYALNSVTITDDSNVSKLMYHRASTIEKPPEKIGDQEITVIGNAFILSLQNDIPSGVPGVDATLSGKLAESIMPGLQNRLMLARMMDADGWQLLEVDNGKIEDGWYTFTADFTSTTNGYYAFVLGPEVEIPADGGTADFTGNKGMLSPVQEPGSGLPVSAVNLTKVSGLVSSSKVTLTDKGSNPEYRCGLDEQHPEGISSQTVISVFDLSAQINGESATMIFELSVTGNPKNIRFIHGSENNGIITWESGYLPSGDPVPKGDGKYEYRVTTSSFSPFAIVYAVPTPAPKSSSTQGTSIWLTAEPTPTETPTPTPTPTPEAPSVKPVETKQAATPVPFMGILAGLGCAAVVFGLRRK